MSTILPAKKLAVKQNFNSTDPASFPLICFSIDRQCYTIHSTGMQIINGDSSGPNGRVVYIEKAVYGAYGLGFIEGKACFVAGALPGDHCRITVIDDRRDFCYGRLDDILESAIARHEPDCTLFGRCGGCQYLMVDYRQELKFKEAIVIDALQRIGGLQPDHIPAMTTIAGERLGYRSHAKVNRHDDAVGFFRRDSHEVVPFAPGGCPLLARPLNEILDAGVTNGITLPSIRIVMDCNGQVLSGNHCECPVRECEGGYIYDRDINGFFQANRYLRSVLIERVLDMAALRGTESAADLACGVGFFSIPLARNAARVTGYDNDRVAIHHARANAVLNGGEKPAFHALSLADINPHHARADVVVVDPPRAGLPRRARRTIIAMGPQRIVSVSCNPSTFARDCREFVAGGYRLSALTLIDMFPATFHIEVLALLEAISR